MLISPAFAAEAGEAAGAPGAFMSMLPLLLVLVVFYFMVIRPQSARMRQHRTMIDNLKKGDKVVTGGGLVASVVKVQGDDEIVLKLADGVEVTALRSTIMTMRHPEREARQK
jgi:preprotein translocase subunit YajC